MLRFLLLWLVTIIQSPVFATAKSAEEVLRFLDSARSAGRASQMELTIRKHDGLEQAYELKDDGKETSILTFLDRRQKGQKVLSTKDELWFISEKTRRSVKIPPIQRLYGDASIGDITRLRYSVDYTASWLEESDTKSNSYCLLLTSHNPGSTYHKIKLWVDKQFLPLKAYMYSASGKHFKTVKYLDSKIEDGFPVVEHWSIYNPNKEDKNTEILIKNFRLIKAKPIEFTRRFLELKR